MTVTLYSITPPTSHSSRYLLRPTVLVAPPPRTDILDDARHDTPRGIHGFDDLTGSGALDILDDIDSMYDQTLEDPVGLLEKSAEITRFP